MHLLPLALLLVGTAAYYDTVLEKKCMALKRNQQNAAYVNGLCFVALKDKTKVEHKDWPSLHDRCKLINGYTGQLAFIPERPFLKKFFKSGVLIVKNKYYIGARRNPIPPCDDNGGVSDYLKCNNGYILIRDRCYKIYTDPANAAASKKQCDKDGGVLASIHDDAMNDIIIGFSRDNTTVDKVVKNPIRFGLSYGSEWINDDSTPVDFFRWWDQAGLPN